MKKGVADRKGLATLFFCPAVERAAISFSGALQSRQFFVFKGVETLMACGATRMFTNGHEFT